jgi:hypothetical protein
MSRMNFLSVTRWVRLILLLFPHMKGRRPIVLWSCPGVTSANSWILGFTWAAAPVLCACEMYGSSEVATAGNTFQIEGAPVGEGEGGGREGREGWRIVSRGTLVLCTCTLYGSISVDVWENILTWWRPLCRGLGGSVGPV